MQLDFNPVYAALREAGAAILDIYKTDFTVEYKEDDSPLTKADILANEILVAQLAQYGFPILSEEIKDAPVHTDAEYLWIIDPLDGTSGFVNKSDQFCVMVALLHKGTPIFGAIYIPTTERLYYAERGGGAFLQDGQNSTPLKMAEVTAVSTARAVVSHSHMTSRMRTMLDIISAKTETPMGSNGLKTVMLLEGSADFLINPSEDMGEWDICAPQILIEEAGGTVTDSNGNALEYNKPTPNTPNGILAAAAAIHKPILDILQA